jgi:S-DNA-T family DNA segregation ATPase FtsK/SpoIIIE
LFLIGLSILLARATWANAAGPLGRWLDTTLRLFIGAVAAALPILFLVSGIR